MSVAVIGSRGRVALPREVRQALGLAEGDRILFLIEGDQVRLARPPEDFGEYLALYGSGLSLARWDDETEEDGDADERG